jgi:glutathione synthase/RimK-type ligase-like ATP-grasp enzyme
MPISHIYVWNQHSEGANNLKELMGIRKIRHEGSRFVGRTSKVVLNWGASQVPEQVARCTIINRPEHVAITSNKLSFFQKLGHIDILPEWTEDFDQASEWVGNRRRVVARTILNGSGGNGIVIMNRNDSNSFVRARLYVRYINKDEEYRIHVVRGNVIDRQRKVLGPEKRQRHLENGETINWKIRNLENGFIYQRNNLNTPPEVEVAAFEALRLSELDFGAVDVIWKEETQRAYVLEVNSAPGLQGTTVENYANALRRI